MIKYCYNKWNANKEKLRSWLKSTENLNSCDYKDLVKAVVAYILNDGTNYTWNEDEITEIDNGEYQGTLLFLIPMETYQPNEYEYIMTYVNYGSCSGCDTLQYIQSLDYGEKYPTDEQVVDFMQLCEDIVCNMIKPYNNGWRYSSEFDTVEF